MTQCLLTNEGSLCTIYVSLGVINLIVHIAGIMGQYMPSLRFGELNIVFGQKDKYFSLLSKFQQATLQHDAQLHLGKSILTKKR